MNFWIHFHLGSSSDNLTLTDIIYKDKVLTPLDGWVSAGGHTVLPAQMQHVSFLFSQAGHLLG